MSAECDFKMHVHLRCVKRDADDTVTQIDPWATGTWHGFTSVRLGVGVHMASGPLQARANLTIIVLMIQLETTKRKRR